jgi:hypothetical protein
MVKHAFSRADATSVAVGFCGSGGQSLFTDIPRPNTHQPLVACQTCQANSCGITVRHGREVAGGDPSVELLLSEGSNNPFGHLVWELIVGLAVAGNATLAMPRLTSVCKLVHAFRLLLVSLADVNDI